MVKKTADKEKKPPVSEEIIQEDKVELSSPSQLTEKLREAEKKAADAHDKYLRLLAEFDNYKKRVEREKVETRKFCNEEIIRDLLPFLDSLRRAIGHAGQPCDIQALQQGLKLIEEQLAACLRKHGLEEIEAKGKLFDPNIHEAILHTESSDHSLNEIIEEYEKGYLLHGRLLKPTRVSVCKGTKATDDCGNGQNTDNNIS